MITIVVVIALLAALFLGGGAAALLVGIAAIALFGVMPVGPGP